MRTAPLLVVLAGVLVGPAAASGTACLPKAEAAWIRVMPGRAMPMQAGYVRLRNTCAAPVAIVGARSDAYGDVSIHETRVVDGVGRMRAVPRLDLPRGATVEMKPGGLHLMLMQPKAGAPEPGDRVRVELQLADGRRLPVGFEARTSAP